MTVHRIGVGVCLFFFWVFAIIWFAYGGMGVLAAPDQSSASDWVLPALALASMACAIVLIVRAPDQQ